MRPYPKRGKGVAPGQALSGEVHRFLSAAGFRMLEPVNGFGRRFLDDGRKFISLDRETLLTKCRKATSLNDFGGDGFLEPLDILLRSFEEDADLNLIGRVTVRHEMLRLLCNRLCIQRDRQQYPAIAQEEIRQPLFITGLPRSGSTFLHALLAQDPGCRSPLVWEVMHPSPPPDCATFRCDPRIALTAKELSWIDVLMPGFERCHCIGATLPQECIAMTDHSFLSYLFESMYYVTSYRSWHDRQDKLPAYRYHRLFLQQLQWRCPGSHWVLKAPSHLMALESLFQVYPDARVVMTHRDPLKVLPSCASFAHLLRAPFTGPIDLAELGGEVSRRWEDSALAATRFRAGASGGGGRFHDVNYPDLLRDPMAVVQGIYRFLDKELAPEAEEAMHLFILQQPKDKHGAHRYSLKQFGLDAEAEREKFQQYSNYFGVTPEI
uniref:Sulfotransferase n=1 Tax=Geobacter sp. (strain M21) TaxID=443144 RepID=C6DYF5_GEOSM